MNIFLVHISVFPRNNIKYSIRINNSHVVYIKEFWVTAVKNKKADPIGFSVLRDTNKIGRSNKFVLKTLWKFFYIQIGRLRAKYAQVCRFVWRCLFVEGSDPFFTKKHLRFYAWNFYPQNTKKARKYKLFEVCIHFIAQVWLPLLDSNQRPFG